MLSSHINIIEAKEFGHRGHVLVVQKKGDTNVSYIVANIYAPNQNNDEKITFFESIFEELANFELKYNCSNIILAGDFNLAMKLEHTKNRAFPISEQRISEMVLNNARIMDLRNVWDDNTLFT